VLAAFTQQRIVADTVAFYDRLSPASRRSARLAVGGSP
jgi:hypothetical protein